MSPRYNNQLVPIVNFPEALKFTKRYDFNLSMMPQEDIWPYIETGRREKTFEMVGKLGEGGAGAVFKEKHKLDGKIYAVKVIRINVPYSKPEGGKHQMGDYVL
jgi:serine/threonine protein kinase